MRRLPPLNALRVFEVAARTTSYAEAAAELGLTHGAVSRQISILEGWLGQRLFVRSGRRMVATPIARVFAAEVSLSFDRLTSAAEACGKPNVRRILRVSAPTSFSTRWLIPRLGRFHDPHPQVEVSVTTVSTVHEELRGGFDIAVRRGTAKANAWPQHRATYILDDVDTLIMSSGAVRAAADPHARRYRRSCPAVIGDAPRRLDRLAGEGGPAAPGGAAAADIRSFQRHVARDRRRAGNRYRPVPSARPRPRGGAPRGAAARHHGAAHRLCRARAVRRRQDVAAQGLRRLAGRRRWRETASGPACARPRRRAASGSRHRRRRYR